MTRTITVAIDPKAREQIKLAAESYLDPCAPRVAELGNAVCLVNALIEKVEAATEYGQKVEAARDLIADLDEPPTTVVYGDAVVETGVMGAADDLLEKAEAHEKLTAVVALDVEVAAMQAHDAAMRAR